MKADFSIVTPSFNQAQFVSHTIESVATQRDVTKEHIVVDPGSTDGSIEILRKFSNIQLIEKKDSCQSEGINNGFLKCSGKYLCWLNSDDIFSSENTLKDVKAVFESNPNCDVVYGNAIFVDKDGEFIKEYYVNGKVDNLLETLEYQVGICQPAVFWRSRVYDKISGLDQSLDFQLDYEYWIRMLQEGFQWIHCNEVLAAHRWWDGMKTASQRDKSLQESINLVKKKFGYVHYKWTDRLAAQLVEASDGIINVSSGNNEESQKLSIKLLASSNTDSKTLIKLSSKNANLGMQETLQKMRDAKLDINPHFFDTTDIDFTEDKPSFLFPEDINAPTPARRPEIKKKISTNIEYISYQAEPDYSVSQKKYAFDQDQKRLDKFLAESNKENHNKTCVIVANGPSLTKSLNEDLFKFDLIISNFSYKSPELLKHAKYFTIVNHTVAEQVYADWNKLEGVKKIFPFWLGKHIPQLEETYFVNSTVVPEFSSDVRKYISWRSTVSYFNMQLAYSLGYRRILLVGFDHSYQQPVNVKEGDEINQIEDDPNHFLPSYFKGKTWQAADTDNMNDSYCEALKFSMDNDVVFINCTVGGELQVFPRGELSTYYSKTILSETQNSAQYQILNPNEIKAISRYPSLFEKYKKIPELREFSSDEKNILIKMAKKNG